jgi:hypothetical protein
MVRPSAGCRPSSSYQLFLLKVSIAMIKVARKIRKPEILCVHIDTLTYILRYLLDDSYKRARRPQDTESTIPWRR